MKFWYVPLLIVFSLPLIILLLIIVDDSIVPEPIMNLYTSVMCGNDEYVYQESQSSYHRSSEVDISIYCRDENGEMNDVSNKFIGLLLGSIAFESLSVIVFVMKIAHKKPVSSVDRLPINSSAIQGMKSAQNTGEIGRETLSEKLKQLDDSYKSRLINRDEYDDARRRILEDWGNK